MTPSLTGILAELDVVAIPTTKQRSTMETCAIATMENILRTHGEGHLRFVLRTLTETCNNNRELVGPVLFAVSDIVADYREWADQVSLWFEAFDAMDIGQLRKALKSRKRGRKRQRLYDAFLTKLETIFQPIPQKDLFA